MRAAAEMNKQSTKGSGGRGGVMGMVLPVYAIGDRGISDIYPSQGTTYCNIRVTGTFCNMLLNIPVLSIIQYRLD